MKKLINLPAIIVSVVVLAGLAVIASKMYPTVEGNDHIVNIPAFSEDAQRGEVAYNETCAACHGIDGIGTDQGPPFLHPVYNPGHHGDRSFVLAVKRGVQQHHWPYGNMPPQLHVKDEDLINIIKYVRELQQANGIEYEKHQM